MKYNPILELLVILHAPYSTNGSIVTAPDHANLPAKDQPPYQFGWSALGTTKLAYASSMVPPAIQFLFKKGTRKMIQMK